MTSSAEISRAVVTVPEAAAALSTEVSRTELTFTNGGVESSCTDTLCSRINIQSPKETVVSGPVKTCKSHSFNHYSVREGSLDLPFILTFTSDEAHRQTIRTIMADCDGNIAMVEGQPDQEVLGAFFSVGSPIKGDEATVESDTLRGILEREELGGGVYTTTTVSATGHGIHRRWHYPNHGHKAGPSDTSVVKEPSQSPGNALKEEPISPTLPAPSLLSSRCPASAASAANVSISRSPPSSRLKRRCDSESNDDCDGASQQNKRRRGHDIPNVKVEFPPAGRHNSRQDTASTKSSEKHSPSDHVQGQEQGKAWDKNGTPKLLPGVGHDTESRRESHVENVPRAGPLTLADLLDDPTVLLGVRSVPNPLSGPFQPEASGSGSPPTSHHVSGTLCSVDAERENKRSPKRPRDQGYDADEELSSEEDRPTGKMSRKMGPSDPDSFGLESPIARSRAVAHSSPVMAAVCVEVEVPSTSFKVKAKSASPPRIRRKASRPRSVNAMRH